MASRYGKLTEEMLQRVRELLECDPELGELRWKERKSKSFNARFSGKVAGYVDGCGEHDYVRVCIDGAMYYAHVLIWALATGDVPNVEIDHRNGCRSDNRLENLRLAGSGINSRNRAIRSDSSTGICGACFDNSRGKYKSYVRLSGKLINLGYFNSADEAGAVAKETRNSLGFSSTHGLTNEERLGSVTT